MASWDTYLTFDDFYQALNSGKLDRSKLTIFVDGIDFFVLNDKEEELISGDETDAIAFMLAQLGIKQGEI